MTANAQAERLQITATLRGLHAARSRLVLRWGNNEEPTAVLAVSPADDALVLDALPDAATQAGLIAAQRVELYGVLDGVSVRLGGGPVREGQHDGRRALCLPLPTSIQREQRRESYRVPAGLVCTVVYESAAGTRVQQLPMHDLSLGGVALVLERCERPPAPGDLIDVCHLPLGEHGPLLAKLEVRNVLESRTRAGVARHRIGCCFVDLPGSAEALLARYISSLERSLRLRR